MSVVIAAWLLATHARPAAALAATPFTGAAWIARAQDVIDLTDSYTALFHEQVLVGDSVRPECVMAMKYRRHLKIYFCWPDRRHRGAEALYVEGWNGNKLRYHQAGFWNLLNFNLDPLGTLAMKGNRHPMTSAGLDYLLGMMSENIARATREGRYAERNLGEHDIYGRRCQTFEGTFVRGPAPDYYCQRAVLDLDVALGVPVQIHCYDWDNRLVEHYGYEHLVLDAGLTDLDFDPDNPAYRF